MKDDLISIIIPVYNTGKYLDNCIKSVADQDYPNIEIIIINDGSNDEPTITICNELAIQYANVIVIHKENGGSASARNYGIKMAHGDYIGFVDSDDIIEPNMYSSLYNDLISHNVKIAIGNIATEENGQLIDRKGSVPEGEYSNKQLLHYFFLGYWHSACTNLYTRSLFDSVQFPEGEVNEDYMLNYWLFKNQDRVYYNNNVFYHYIRRKGSNTSSPVTMSFLDWIKHTSAIRQDYQNCDNLREEADYQYLYSNIVLGNKCLLSLGKGRSEDADKLYKTVTDNLKQERKKVFHNKFLTKRYRIFGILLSCIPHLYKAAVIPVVHAIK